MITNHPVIGIAAAARRAKVSERRIRQLLKDGTISGQRLDPINPDSTWAIDIESLESWINTPQGVGCPRGFKRNKR